MNDIIVIEWKFSPPDYFEEPLHIEHQIYSIVIENGKIEARIESTAYGQNPNMLDKLHSTLNDRFLGVQLLTYRPYELSKASVYRLHPDGRKEVTIFPEPMVIKITMGIPDIIMKDKHGYIISDSKRDRIEKKNKIAELIKKHRPNNNVVDSILKSYNAAVTDPNNELVHLYEIRDALSSKFGSDKNARTALGISKSHWSRLGKLANDEPIRQGRHRGKTISGLREATEDELTEARNIARNMIETYLEYLENV